MGRENNGLVTNTGMIPTGIRTFGGRPRKYLSGEEMRPIIEAYFDMCETFGRPYTSSGLAVALGVTTRRLKSYREDPVYQEVLSWAMEVITDQVETRLIEGEVNPNGLMFWLKNRGTDYVDKVEMEHTGEVSLVHAIQAARARVQRALAGEEVIDIRGARPVADTKVREAELAKLAPHRVTDGGDDGSGGL